MSDTDRAAAQARYQTWRELPAEDREWLRERWEAMSPEERRRAIQRRQGPKPGSVARRPCPPC